MTEFITNKVLNETNYVSLDSATRRKRLERQATLMAAKEANDPLYIKYAKDKNIETSRNIEIPLGSP